MIGGRKNPVPPSLSRIQKSICGASENWGASKMLLCWEFRYELYQNISVAFLGYLMTLLMDLILL